jgi:hypothetical protein
VRTVKASYAVTWDGLDPHTDLAVLKQTMKTVLLAGAREGLTVEVSQQWILETELERQAGLDEQQQQQRAGNLE